MRIGEIAEKTGLSISNIRFYEKKGLIGPDREDQSKYRNYTKEDLNRLKKIILYRKMDFPIEIIGKIFENEISVEDALERQLLELKAKQQMIQGSIDLCQKVIENQAFKQMDVDYYMEYVKEEEAKGKIFAKIDELLVDFSDFTKFDYFVGDSYLGELLYSKPWIRRVVMAVWCVCFALIPIIGIVDELLDGDVSMIMLAFWVLWIVFFIFSFVSFQRAKRK